MYFFIIFCSRCCCFFSWINNGCGSGPRSQVWSQWWKWDKTLWPHVYLSSDGPNCCNYPHFFGSNGNWCQSGTDGCHFAQEAIAKVSFLFSITRHKTTRLTEKTQKMTKNSFHIHSHRIRTFFTLLLGSIGCPNKYWARNKWFKITQPSSAKLNKWKLIWTLARKSPQCTKCFNKKFYTETLCHLWS